MQTRQTTTAFRRRKVTATLRKRAPGPSHNNRLPGGSLQINLWRAKAVSLSELPKLSKFIFVKS